MNTMELSRHRDFRYTFTPERGKNGRWGGYVLEIYQPYGDIELPRYAGRYNIPPTFRSEKDAVVQAQEVARRLSTGELSPISEKIEENIGDYKIIASGRLVLSSLKWEPTLTIKSRRKCNKGATQDFNDVHSALRRNPFREPGAAAKFALERGKDIVLRYIPGLKI
jgi:hypothetical protein